MKRLLFAAIGALCLVHCASEPVAVIAEPTASAEASLDAVMLWEQASPPMNPGRLAGAHMTYDPKHRVVFLQATTGLWQWDGAAMTWTPLCTVSPCKLESAPIAYDQARDRLVGYFADGTSEWNGAQWIQACAKVACGPNMPRDAALAYDERLQKVLMVTEYDVRILAWDGAVWTPQCTSAECLATAPKGQPSAVTYDSGRSRLQIKVQNMGRDQDVLWEWDGTRYAKACAAGVCGAAMPQMELGCLNTMVYDPAHRRTVLFAHYAILASETWTWTEATGWVKLKLIGSPTSRTLSSMIYDGARGRMLLYGGNGTLGAGLSSETWTLRSVGGSCTSDAQCGGQHCVEGECCEAACGACERCDARTHASCTPVRNADTQACSGASTCDESATCRLKQGRACSTGADCLSGFCADGVCCDSACGDACGVCAAAHGAPADGTCGPAPAGTPGTPACGAYTCNGAQLSCPSACAADADCASGFTCDSSHRCVLRVTCEGSSLHVGNDEIVSCGNYLCELSGTCKTTCESVADCAEPFICDGAGRCVPAPDGEPATDGGGEVSCSAGGAPVHADGVALAVVAGAGWARARRRRPKVVAPHLGSP